MTVLVTSARHRKKKKNKMLSEVVVMEWIAIQSFSVCNFSAVFKCWLTIISPVAWSAFNCRLKCRSRNSTTTNCKRGQKKESSEVTLPFLPRRPPPSPAPPWTRGAIPSSAVFYPEGGESRLQRATFFYFIIIYFLQTLASPHKKRLDRLCLRISVWSKEKKWVICNTRVKINTI